MPQEGSGTEQGCSRAQEGQGRWASHGGTTASMPPYFRWCCWAQTPRPAHLSGVCPKAAGLCLTGEEKAWCCCGSGRPLPLAPSAPPLPPPPSWAPPPLVEARSMTLLIIRLVSRVYSAAGWAPQLPHESGEVWCVATLLPARKCLTCITGAQNWRRRRPPSARHRSMARWAVQSSPPTPTPLALSNAPPLPPLTR